MNTNKHESSEIMEECPLIAKDKLPVFSALKVVVSILEHTTQQCAIEGKTKAPRMMNDQLSYLQWLKNFCVNPRPSVVPTLSVYSVCSVVTKGGAE